MNKEAFVKGFKEEIEKIGIIPDVPRWLLPFVYGGLTISIAHVIRNAIIAKKKRGRPFWKTLWRGER